MKRMAALFHEILRRRNEIQQEEQLRQRARYQNSFRVERALAARADARQLLDSSTRAVLEPFCKSAYPSMKIRTYAQGWSIGRWTRAKDNSQVWESIIDITLRYDSLERPVTYECRGHNRRIVAVLTPDALRQTLLRLYRPRQVAAARTAQ